MISNQRSRRSAQGPALLKEVKRDLESERVDREAIEITKRKFNDVKHAIDQQFIEV